MFKSKKFSFLNKYVAIVTTQTVDGVEAVNKDNYTIKMPVSYKGFLLQEDAAMYYLGDDRSKIVFGVPKKAVAMIEILVEPLPIQLEKGKTFLINKDEESAKGSFDN